MEDRSTSTSTEQAPAGERGSRVALAGLVFAVLFVVTWLLGRNIPTLDTSTDELVKFYNTPDSRRGALISGLYLIPFAAIAFLWFAAALRDRYLGMHRREHTLFSTVYLLSAALFTAALFIVAAVRVSLVWLAESSQPLGVDPANARTMIAFGQSLSEIMALRTGAVFILVSTARAKRVGLFPAWYSLLSMAVAVAMLVVYSAWRPVSLLMPAWVLGTSLVVLARRQLREMASGS